MTEQTRNTHRFRSLRARLDALTAEIAAEKETSWQAWVAANDAAAQVDASDHVAWWKAHGETMRCQGATEALNGVLAKLRKLEG